MHSFVDAVSGLFPRRSTLAASSIVGVLVALAACGGGGGGGGGAICRGTSTSACTCEAAVGTALPTSTVPVVTTCTATSTAAPTCCLSAVSSGAVKSASCTCDVTITACNAGETPVTDCRSAAANAVAPTPTPDAGTSTDAGGTSPLLAQCDRDVFAYTGALSTCFTNIAAPTSASIDAACARSDSKWPGCLGEVEAFTACKSTLNCSAWIVDCWSDLRALDLCLGAADPGPTPPSNPATAGFDGASTTCDSTTCSGTQTECGDTCLTCNYACSGNSCQQTCDF